MPRVVVRGGMRARLWGRWEPHSGLRSGMESARRMRCQLDDHLRRGARPRCRWVRGPEHRVPRMLAREQRKRVSLAPRRSESKNTDDQLFTPMTKSKLAADTWHCIEAHYD